ncbi:MAG: c-type cytochrome [Gammaproteobacteria bacterium]|nr:c-type cytochrome [Gammaproteobacteria bacterium]
MLNTATTFLLLLALVLVAPAVIAVQPAPIPPALRPAADSDKNQASKQNDSIKNDDDEEDDDEDKDEDNNAEKPKPVDAHTASMLGLAQKSGCLACHKIERKLVGPGWSDVAQRYKNDPNAHSKLFEKVSRGGGGNWTEVTDGKQMPPYGERVAPEDIATLVDFVLSLPPP